MTVDASHLTEQMVRNAPPEKLNRWAAFFRGIDSGKDPKLGEYWVWGDPPLHPEGEWEEPHVRPCPPQYANCDWAAGRLLDDLQGTVCEGDFLPEEGPEWGVAGAGDEWRCGPEWHEGIDPFGWGETRQIAICRAFLVAALRGLLDVGVQGELEV